MNMHHPDPRLVEAVLRRDFYSFVQAIFPLVSPNTPLARNWHLAAIAHALTQVLLGVIRRLIITVPPRNLKSIISSVAFPAFALGHNPKLRFICASYSEGLAFAHSRSCREVMRSALYHRLFPHTQIVGWQDNQAEFSTTKGGFRLSTSVGGTLTGRGGNVLIVDDAIKAQDALSDSARENANEWFDHTFLSRLDNKVQDSIIVVMQRLHVDDLAGHLLERGEWTHLKLPAIAETDQQIPISPGRTHYRRTGDLLHPEREPQSVLDEAKTAMGSMAFAAQYQQEPVSAEGNLLKWNWFRFYDNLPKPRKGDRIVVSWDTASSQKELASYSVAVVLQVREETVFLLDVVRGRFDHPELIRQALELHHKWKNTCQSYELRYALLIEDKGSGTGLIQHLKSKNIHAIPIKLEGDKVMRMNNQTGRIEAGSVLLPGDAPWLGDFRVEICAFPGGRYNDQVDAFSQGLNYAFTPQPRLIVGSYNVY